MKRILTIAVVFTLLASCKKEMISESADKSDLKVYAEMATDAMLMKSKDKSEKKDKDDKDKSKDKQESKTFKINGSGNISYLPNGCGESTLQFRSEGTGNASHIGSLRQATEFCISMATGEPMGPINGVGTTPNGDKLYYSLVGAGTDAATGYMFQKYIFTGGTGKFDDASGSFTLLYNVNNPSNYEYTGTGTIVY